MWQTWQHLLFLHWVVPADHIRRLLPAGLELDTFEGNAYVGLIPFTMTGVRPSFLPPAGPLSNFHEVNVRTYVHVGGQHPGVWFFSLDAANPLAVIGARALYKLPYYFARMSLKLSSGGVIDYSSDRRLAGPRPAACSLSYRPYAEARPALVGTLDHFLVERYILYARSGGRPYRGRIHHRPYPLQQAELLSFSETLLAAARIARPANPPLIHYARELRVEIFGLRRADAPSQRL